MRSRKQSSTEPAVRCRTETQETERRRRERNEVEQDVEVAVREKNRDALSRKLEIEQQEAFMTLEQEQQVKTRTAEQNARIAAFEAERRREAEQTRILAERQIKLASGRQDPLTKRERQVAEKLAQGMAVKEIAAELGLSPKTVHVHRANLMEKLGVSNDVELARRMFDGW